MATLIVRAMYTTVMMLRVVAKIMNVIVKVM